MPFNPLGKRQNPSGIDIEEIVEICGAGVVTGNQATIDAEGITEFGFIAIGYRADGFQQRAIAHQCNEITELQICRCTGIETIAEIEPINVQIRGAFKAGRVDDQTTLQRIFSPEIDCNETVDPLVETCIPGWHSIP